MKSTGEIAGTDRLGLSPSPVLVIWTAPAGPDVLAQALQIVNPVRVYVFALQPVTNELRGFLERLAGMVKHDLRARGGRVDVCRLAAALGHREATVRAGVDWLVARGELRIVEADGDTLVLQVGGEALRDPAAVEFRLRRLLDETAAYRRHFCSAPTEMLGISE